MTTSLDWPAVIASAAGHRRLPPRHDLAEPGWTFWELRTLNLHRVVALLKADREFASGDELETTIREVVARNFQRSWWRGIAYGVVAEVAAITLTRDDVENLVDIRENSKGTLQWVILVTGRAPVALGVHTWVEGYLSPVYRGTLHALAEAGYEVTSVKREKDGLMRVLTGVADVNVTLRSLGTLREAFPEFHDNP